MVTLGYIDTAIDEAALLPLLAKQIDLTTVTVCCMACRMRTLIGCSEFRMF